MDNKRDQKPFRQSPLYEFFDWLSEVLWGEPSKTKKLREMMFRMVTGDHPLLVLAEQSDVSENRLAEVMGFSSAQLRALQNHPDGSFHGLRKEAVTKFCDYYKISPADIVPLMDNPFLSLPPEITEAILYRLQSNPNLEDEKAAIACEKRRYRRFGEHPLFVDVSRWFSQIENRSGFVDIFNRLGEDQGGTGNFENLAPLGLELLLEEVEQGEHIRTLNQKISNRMLEHLSTMLREATFDLFGAEHEGYVSHDLLQKVERGFSQVSSGRDGLESVISLLSSQVCDHFLSREFKGAQAAWSKFGWQDPCPQDFQERVREYLGLRIRFREARQREEDFRQQISHADRGAEEQRIRNWIEQITAPSGVCVRRLVANHVLIAQFEHQQSLSAKNETVYPEPSLPTY